MLDDVVDADSMEQRHFMALRGLSLTPTAEQWLFDLARVTAAVQGKRVRHAVVDDLEHPYASSAAVREFDARVRDLLGPMST